MLWTSRAHTLQYVQSTVLYFYTAALYSCTLSIHTPHMCGDGENINYVLSCEHLFRSHTCENVWVCVDGLYKVALGMIIMASCSSNRVCAHTFTVYGMRACVSVWATKFGCDDAHAFNSFFVGQK